MARRKGAKKKSTSRRRRISDQASYRTIRTEENERKGEVREDQAAKAHKKKDDNKKSDDETKNDQLKQDRVAGRGRSEKGSWGRRSAGHTQTLDRD